MTDVALVLADDQPLVGDPRDCKDRQVQPLQWRGVVVHAKSFVMQWLEAQC